MALSIMAVNVAIELLLKETDEKPAGIIVGIKDAQYIGELLSNSDLMNHISVSVLKNLPVYNWIIYNNNGFIHSDCN